MRTSGSSPRAFEGAAKALTSMRRRSAKIDVPPAGFRYVPDFLTAEQGAFSSEL